MTSLIITNFIPKFDRKEITAGVICEIANSLADFTLIAVIKYMILLHYKTDYWTDFF